MSGPFLAGPAELRRTDTDVAGVVGRMPDHLPTERVRRDRSADPLVGPSAAVLAGDVAPAWAGDLVAETAPASFTSAFQLRDDLDDVFGDPRMTGEAYGGDIGEGEPACPVTAARTRRNRRQRRCVGRAGPVARRRGAHRARSATGAGRVDRDGGALHVKSEIGRLAARGPRRFDGALFDAEGAGPLRGLPLAAADARPGGDGTARLRTATDPYATHAWAGSESGR